MLAGAADDQLRLEDHLAMLVPVVPMPVAGVGTPGRHGIDTF
jgi:hypothetical protein